jgi:hypothetical protein
LKAFLFPFISILRKNRSVQEFKKFLLYKSTGTHLNVLSGVLQSIPYYSPNELRGGPNPNSSTVLNPAAFCGGG